MKNIIRNISVSMTDSNRKLSGIELAIQLAKENELSTGNITSVIRVLDYVDVYNNRDREHYSFDVVELLNEQ